MKSLTHTIGIALLGIASTVPLAACNSGATPATPTAAVTPLPPRAPPKCYDCGTITNIEQLKAKGKASGLGIVVGAVAGAVIGHQIGGGKGNDVATATGAIGGGIAGNEVEKRIKGTTYFQVTVAMENGGGTRTVDVESLNGLSTGSRVKVVGNNLQMAGA